MNKSFIQIGGTTICLKADIDFNKARFKPEIQPFLVNQPGGDIVFLERHFSLPDIRKYDLGTKIYTGIPWTIYENEATGHYYYLRTGLEANNNSPQYFADFSSDFSIGKIFTSPVVKENILSRGWQNLTGFASDSMYLGQVFAERSAILMHSAAVTLNGQGLMFIGRSEAGKTTTTRMVKSARDNHGASASILCDETNILRRWEKGWRVHGTWGHGEEEEVSGKSGPLLGIFMLKQDKVNTIKPISDSKLILNAILSTVFRPLMTVSWWKKAIQIIRQLVEEVQFYEYSFDKSGQIIPVLEDLTKGYSLKDSKD